MAKKYNYLKDKDYKPIILSKTSIALIQIFTRDCEFIEIYLDDCEQHDVSKIWKKAAEEFVKQLKGHWCLYFMEELLKAIKKEMKKDPAYHSEKRILEKYKKNREFKNG